MAGDVRVRRTGAREVGGGGGSATGAAKAEEDGSTGERWMVGGAGEEEASVVFTCWIQFPSPEAISSHTQ